MERLTKRISESLIELSAKANPIQYNGSPQRVHVKHPFWNVFNRLCAYEDAEEQGLLLRLPCKVGDTIYIIDDLNNIVLRGTVKDFTEDKIRIARGYLIHVEYKNSVISESWEEFSEVGKTVFLTKEEAEQALARMEGEDD